MKNTEKKLNLLKAKKNLLAAGAVVASIGTTAAIPTAVCNAIGIDPFDKYAQCNEYITTTTSINSATGEGTRNVDSTYYDTMASKFNTVPVNKINAKVEGVAFDYNDNMIGIVDDYSIPYTEENLKLANNCTSYEEIEPLLTYKVNSTISYLGRNFNEDYDGNEEFRELLDQPIGIDIESGYLSNEIVEVEKTGTRRLYEAIIFGGLLYASATGSFYLYGSLKNALSKNIDAEIESLENDQKLVLK